MPVSQEMKPFLMPESSEEDVGPLGTEILALKDRQLRFMRPKAPDRLLDLETVAVAHDQDQYMPYWAALWPVSTYLAQTIDRTQWMPPIEGIELGCGLGLPGLAALAHGIQMTFTDYDATALRLVAQSVDLNKLDGARYLHFDWRSLLVTPLDDRLKPLINRYDLVLASDLIYEERQVKPLVAAMKLLVKPDGVVFVADQDRPYREFFLEEISQAGFVCRKWPVPKKTFGSLDVSGSVYILTLKESATQPAGSFQTLSQQKPIRWMIPEDFSLTEG